MKEVLTEDPQILGVTVKVEALTALFKDPVRTAQ